MVLRMENSANKRIRNILEKVLNEHFLGRKKERLLVLELDQVLKGVDINLSQLVQIMQNLQERKIVSKFALYNSNPINDPSNPLSMFETDRLGLNLPPDFQSKAQDYLEELQADEPTSGMGLVLYLDRVGNLWHGDKNDFCYKMDQGSDRLFIFSHLVDNKGYQSTSSISDALGGKDKQNVRTEITKMRGLITKRLGIIGSDLIQSKKDSGYRINPKYQIIPSNG